MDTSDTPEHITDDLAAAPAAPRVELFSVDPRLAARWPASMIAYGAGTDLDEAFDVAVSDALTDFGQASPVVCAARFDPASMSERSGPPSTFDAQILAAQVALDTGAVAAGTVSAFAVCSPRSMLLRRERLVVTDVDVELPAPGEPVCVTVELLEALAALGAAPEPGEHVASVAVTADRVRFKAAASTFPAPNESRFVARDADGAAVASAAKMADLRRELMGFAREKDRGSWEVSVRKEQGRASGDPLLVVARRVVGRRATLRVVFASPREGREQRTVGWVFAGRFAT